MQNEIMQNEITEVEDKKLFLESYKKITEMSKKKEAVSGVLNVAAHFIAIHRNDDAKLMYKQIREVIFFLSLDASNLDEIIDLLNFIFENSVEHELFRIFVSCAMSIASKEFREILEARLKIYDVLLSYDPFDNRLKSLMRKLAREDFSEDKNKIYNLLDKYSEKNKKELFGQDKYIKAMNQADYYLCKNDSYNARKIYRAIKDYIIFDVIPDEGLEAGLVIFRNIMKYKNSSDCFGLFIASLMSLASREYRYNLDARLVIYSLILDYYPGDIQTIAIMKALARDEYADDKASLEKINSFINKHAFEYSSSEYDSEKFKQLWEQLQVTESEEIALKMKKILSHSKGNEEFLEAAYGTYLEFAKKYPDFIP